MSAERRIQELGIVLPPASAPVASYVNAVRAGKLLFLAGKGPMAPRRDGIVGADIDVATARDHARGVGLMLVAALKGTIGDLDQVRRIVRLLGMVRAQPDFTEHARVIDGCSDLLVEIFGEAGRHARTSIGLPGLPFGITVEIEAIVELL